MKTSGTPHPTRTEFQDVVDLSGGRIWMLSFEDPDCLENIPRLFLELYQDMDALEDLQNDGLVWLLPEDMPRVIEMLAGWLDVYRRCAREGSNGPLPHPNWGNLDEPTENGQAERSSP